MNSNVIDNKYDMRLPQLIYIRFQKTINIPGSSNLNITREEMGWFVPTGYRPIGLVSFEVASNQVIVRGINPFNNPDDNEPMIWLRNKSSSAYNDAIIAVTYAFINTILPMTKDEDVVYYNHHMFGANKTTTWSDWERDLPENAGVLLTMENAGPVTNS